MRITKVKVKDEQDNKEKMVLIHRRTQQSRLVLDEKMKSQNHDARGFIISNFNFELQTALQTHRKKIFGSTAT